jgi:hypothetical protein
MRTAALAQEQPADDLVEPRPDIWERPELLRIGGGAAGDEVLATAILDRLLHRSHVLNISGRSYRMRELDRAAAAARATS